MQKSKPTLSRVAPVAALVAVAGCAEPELLKDTAEFDAALATEAECMNAFEDGVLKWGGKDVVASFTYEIPATAGDPLEIIYAADWGTGTGFSGSVTDGSSNPEQAVTDFLAEEAGGETATLLTEDAALFRVSSSSDSYGELIEAGCARVKDSIALRQVRFLQGGR